MTPYTPKLIWGKLDPTPYFSDKAVEAQRGMEVYSLSPSKAEQRGTDLAEISSLPTNFANGEDKIYHLYPLRQN